jgi:hypothetical protein
MYNIVSLVVVQHYRTSDQLKLSDKGLDLKVQIGAPSSIVSRKMAISKFCCLNLNSASACLPSYVINWIEI